MVNAQSNNDDKSVSSPKSISTTDQNGYPKKEASDDVAETEQKTVDEIESLCMNCHENGSTRFLLTRIPFFREVIISSFHCPHCNFRNSEIQPAGEIQPKGLKYVFKPESKEDLNRQIVKSDTCTFRIEDIDLEIPAGRGQLTNIEGILLMAQKDLESKQDERKKIDHELHEKIDVIIQRLSQMRACQCFPFTVSIDDPAGNSWIEPNTTDRAGKRVKHDYSRTSEQIDALGLAVTDEVSGEPVPTRPEYRANQMYPHVDDRTEANNVDEDDEIIENRVYTFPDRCSSCRKTCETNMKMVNIPYFKEIVLMSTFCNNCGYKSSEVKTGGEIPEKGRQIAISVKGKEDLNRDILKSETCSMECPELELHIEAGTLGGRFTTIEGLLTQVRDDLRMTIFGDVNTGTAAGDSMAPELKEKWSTFFERLETAIRGERKFQLVLKDPFASSYVQSQTAPEPDSQISILDYNRTDEEEESLGLKDIKTEGYEDLN